MRTVFKDAAGKANWIFDAMKSGYRPSFETFRVHYDGIAFDLSIEVEMRAVAGVESGIVLKNCNSGFNCVERIASGVEDGPAGFDSATTSCFTASTASSGISQAPP
jgi:SH3-like domain-containing protein